MITETEKMKNRASWVRALNKDNWTNKKIADTLGLSVIEVSKILIGD